MHVPLYKSERGKSRTILPRSGYQGAAASQEARIQPRRHALVRVLHPALAAG